MPSNRFPILLTLLTSLVLATGVVMAEEGDLSGTWKMTMLHKSPTGDKEADLTFERDGFSLMVTMTGASGKVECQGYIDDPELRFYCVVPGKKGDVMAKFSGHKRGDLMGTHDTVLPWIRLMTTSIFRSALVDC